MTLVVIWQDVDLGDELWLVRQGLTIGYNDQKIAYMLWYRHVSADELSSIHLPANGEAYLADPNLFDFLAKVIPS